MKDTNETLVCVICGQVSPRADFITSFRHTPANHPLPYPIADGIWTNPRLPDLRLFASYVPVRMWYHERNQATHVQEMKDTTTGFLVSDGLIGNSSNGGRRES